VWGVVALDIAAVVAVAVGLLPEAPGTPEGGPAIFLILTATCGLVAGRVMVAQPGNRVGWLLWAQPTCIAVSGVGQSYALLSIERAGGAWPGSALLAWLGGLTLLLFIAITVLLIPLVFPDGHLPSRRWRPAAVIVILAAVTTVVASGGMFTPGPLNGFAGLDNPFGIPGGESIQELGGPLNALLIFIGLPLAIASVVTRFRRGTAVERQQVKWFAAGVAVPAMLLVASLALQAVTPLWVLTIVAMDLIPLATAVAILRYRLYEIDRIVSRTIGWAASTAMVVGLFGAGLVALETLLAGVTQGSTLAVAGSTLAAFAAFQPIRRHVQSFVDRRFDRARYDAARIAGSFAARLRGQLELGAVEAELVATTASALRPAGAGLWLRDRTSQPRRRSAVAP
jgi:hypothetical protein